ncbi:MAG TPA: TonB-dependent receptor [Usitatibacter sp.]|nr:TonB-dependent receptor [Usitatibacter sp.]
MRAIRSVLGALSAFAALHALGAAPAQRAEIVGIQGQGEYRPERELSWSAAHVKQPLFAADFVRTLGMSRMEIRFWNGVTQTLDHDGQMQVLDDKAARDTKCTVMQARSRSWGVARTPPEGFSVCTPSATAAIRGTEWEIAVAADGTSTLSVFNGVVRFYNEHGEVEVHPNEQARAEIGKAPVKLFLRVTRSRVQWVNAFAVDPLRYAEFHGPLSPALAAIGAALRDDHLQQAYDETRRLASAAAPPAVALLLLADFETYRGDLPAARRAAEEGARRYPGDERFDVSAARSALFAGEIAAAYAHADAALAKRPGSVDALVMRADIDRHEGRGREAIEEYTRAVHAAALDARPWYGRGVVESEREDVRRGRADLAKAIELDPSDATYPAELGTLEGFADLLGAGQRELERALKMQPDNYVALTGLGVVQLKEGDAEAAIASFQRASAIEPRYARAHLYSAAAYYQERRDHDALTELQRAAELDPNDPLPHLLMSMIYLDRIEPGDAAAEAQAALARVPFLKSVNGVADNQKGIANFGAPLAFMGLEEWARSTAHDSYLPFWGASHLFLADRYPGDFNRRSELMQGFITDPLAFGASNRFVTLFPEPGLHATASILYSTSDDLRVTEPVLTVNGYDVSRFPVSYLAEAIDTKVDPGNSDVSIRAHSYTGALGMRPVPGIGTFLYANRFDVDADLGRSDVPGVFQHIDGTVTRVDAGLRIAPGPDSSLWIKAGGSHQDSTLDESDTVAGDGFQLLRQSHFTLEPKSEDAALRHTFSIGEDAQLDWGVEGARVETPSFLGEDSAFHFADAAVAAQSLAQSAHDRSGGIYASGRITHGALRLEAGLGFRDYRKDRDLDFLVGGEPSHQEETLERRRGEPFLGVTWRPIPAVAVRAACRRWLRPAALETLAPVAVAGMPLDDQLVYAGGLLDQCRAQWEWTAPDRTFVAARVERSRVQNLWSPLDGVQNAEADVTNLERLRNRVLTPPPIPDQLEDDPVFAAGVAKRATVAIERIVTATIAARAYYTYTGSVNDGPAYPGRAIPYFPRHQVNVGGTWAPGWHTLVTLQAVYRTLRYTDEANTSPLPSSWDAEARVYFESPDKRWSVEAVAANLLKKEASDVFGVTVSYRY